MGSIFSGSVTKTGAKNPEGGTKLLRQSRKRGRGARNSGAIARGAQCIDRRWQHRCSRPRSIEAHQQRETVIDILLDAGLGAAAGEAAARQGNPRTGYAGPAAAFEVDLVAPLCLHGTVAQQQHNREMAALDQELMRTQIENQKAQASLEMILSSAGGSRKLELPIFKGQSNGTF